MLLLLTTLLGASSFAVVGCMFLWDIQYFYEWFYAPLIFFLAGILIMLIFWWCFIWFVGRFVKKKPHNKPSRWARFWLEAGINFALIMSNSTVKVNGKDKLPTNERFLLVCNHRSNWDPMVMAVKLKKYDLAFVTKRGNYAIPLFGRLLYGCCYYPLDRADKLQSLSIFHKCSDLIDNDYASVGIFPEGTRQRDDILGPYHEGTFNVAIRSKCPIVIVTCSGMEMLVHNYPWRHTKMSIDILGVIPYEEYEGETAKAISDKVHDIMEEHLTKINIMKHQEELKARELRKQSRKIKWRR